jgi:hypothetical protein
MKGNTANFPARFSNQNIDYYDNYDDQCEYENNTN